MLLPPATLADPGDSALSCCSSPSHKQFERAKNSAAGHLARRPHSRQELERKLHEKGHDAKAVQQALERLAELVSSRSRSSFLGQMTMVARSGGFRCTSAVMEGALWVLCGLLILASNKPLLNV